MALDKRVCCLDIFPVILLTVLTVQIHVRTSNGEVSVSSYSCCIVPATISANTSLNCWYEPSGSKPSFPPVAEPELAQLNQLLPVHFWSV